MKRATLYVASMILALTGMGCDEKLASITGPTPNLEPTLSSISRNIFNATDSSGRLACTGCHSDQGRNPSGQLVLLEGRAFQFLVGTPSSGKPGEVRVIPGDPDNSYIIKKLEGAPGIVGTRMPRGNVVLEPGQILVIRRWIQLGAQNN